MTKKAEHRAFTLKQKAELIEKFDSDGLSKHQFATDNAMSRSTLRGILALRKKTFEAIRNGTAPRRKKLRTSLLGESEAKLVEWTQNKASQHLAVTGELLKEKAKQLAKKAKLPNFKASPSWLGRFKSRNRLCFKKMSGEAGSVDIEEVEHFLETELRLDLKRYPVQNVYNCDQFGLFFKLTPDRTLTVKGSHCTGRKLSKERITVHVCCNMTGDVKRALLAIGKSRKPRCFAGQKIPIDYDSSPNAWMNGEIYKRWLIKWNDELAAENRHVLLYADNFLRSSLENLNLSHIELKFLPPNTTAVFQPLDAGIIKDIKFKYKLALLKKMVSALDAGKNYKIDLLKALRILRDSWLLVKEATIRNCFRHAHFANTPLEEPENYDNAIDEIIGLWESLELNDKTDGAKLTEFVELDDQIEDHPLVNNEELSDDEHNHSEEEQSEAERFEIQDITEEDEMFLMDLIGPSR